MVGAIAPIIGALAGQIGKTSQADKDQEQVQQQGRLQQQQIAGAKEMTDYNQLNQMKTWNETNYEAQVQHIVNAGLNPALLYGGGGGGGATVGSAGGAMPTGGVAPNSAEQSNADTNKTNSGIAMAMMLGQQKVMETQAEKNEADADLSKVQANKLSGVDTENVATNTANTAEITKQNAFQNAVNDAVGIETAAQARKAESDIKQIQFEKDNALWETFKTQGYPSGNVTDGDNPVAKAMKAGWEQTVQDLTNAKTQNNIQQATAIIEGFKANLAKNGISPDSPWYVKILGDLLDKIGMNPINTVKNVIKQ